MSRAREIYSFDKRIEKDLELIKSDPHNAAVLQKYYNSRVAEGISVARICKCINTMKLISRMLQLPFENATKDDIVRLVAQIEKRAVSDWTKHDYKVILKHFYKWLRNCEDGISPPEVRWLRKLNNVQNKRPILPKDLLTPEEKLAMMRATQNPRDRALVEVFCESGRRFGEIVTVHTSEVDFDEIGAKLMVNGKVGNDYVRVISAAPSLAAWLNCHPMRDNPDAPVWIGLGRSNANMQISHVAVNALLKKIARRAGVKKRVFGYLFRHTRIDETQGILTESQQCTMFGWRFGSRMPAVYFKRYGKHIDDAQAIMNGIVPPKRQAPIAVQAPECPRCRQKNSPAAKFCSLCGCVLDLQTTLKLDEEKRMAEELLARVTRDPELREKLTAFLEGSP